MENFFYSFDGDDIGRDFEKIVFNEGLAAAQEYNRNFIGAMDLLVSNVLSFGAVCQLRAGDSIIATSQFFIDPEKILLLHNGFSFSLGIGDSLERSSLALKLAKAKGKSRAALLIDENRKT